MLAGVERFVMRLRSTPDGFGGNAGPGLNRMKSLSLLGLKARRVQTDHAIGGGTAMSTSGGIDTAMGTANFGHRYRSRPGWNKGGSSTGTGPTAFSRNRFTHCCRRCWVSVGWAAGLRPRTMVIQSLPWNRLTVHHTFVHPCTYITDYRQAVTI